MSGHFVVKSKKNLDDLNVGDIINESDYATLTPSGNFVQMEYVKNLVKRTTAVKPGLWKIQKSPRGLQLVETEFVKETVLDKFVNTQEIESSVDCFFSNLQVYYDHGIEVPKHSILMYGPPGGGKTTAISKVCKRYLADNKTACIIWNTDKFESYEVKDLISTLSYTGLDRLILIAEDLGGVEVEGRDRASDSSLLSILDNKEKTFNIPTLILSTTNYPENFMENLTNRPERFDDKIEVKYPSPDSRIELLKFFLKSEDIQPEIETLIKSTKCNKFTPAHIKQAVIRMATKKKPLLDALQSVCNDIERYNKGFRDKREMGL